ncbi:Cro/CI family transcriptional regulator [Castellaniella denitrificans]|uniref:Cro/CI family transcriptional regulator n=1 Tax=Castellaniella denitrificans TaxID=56119 RepID=A0ABT4LZP5_9BURK|nr:Cro/CI family transcriptional regulator [Castellaniella denitrificans]MCZ4328516.1 Cro/CI family transcriptional regulator [Castellaniella denitrificans]
MSDFQPIREACALVGSATALAEKLGVTAVTVSDWAMSKRPVPIIRCVEIEELTGGAVTRKQLRPDDWWQIWPDLRGTN